MESCLYRLTGGKRFADKLRNSFKDDLNMRPELFIPRYGHLQRNPPPLITYLVNESLLEFASIDAFDRLSFNMPAVRKRLPVDGACSDLNNHILAHFSYFSHHG